jgi:CsoR family transcriptional regulator, copper-sensing transcriptional repressor
MVASNSLSEESSTLLNRHTHEGKERAHVHTESSRQQIINRLSRIEGHIRGIKAMVQENTDCPQVLIQIAAVRGALDRVSRIILDEHLTQCIARAAKEGNIDAEIQDLKAALDRFLPGEKPAKHKVKGGKRS